MIINAKQELIEHIEYREVKYVAITLGCDSCNGRRIEGTLSEVLPQLDFEYGEGFGDQEIDGTIWYMDGTWSVRMKYCGAEWWSHQKCPKLPEGLSFNFLE